MFPQKYENFNLSEFTATLKYVDQAESDAIASANSYADGLASNYATAAQGAKADQAFTHSQEDHAPSNAEKNIIIGIQRNGVSLTPNASRIVNISVPEQISELENDSEYITINNTGNTYTPGVTKIYQSTGNAADGCMSQRATSEALSTKADDVHSHIILNTNEPQHQNNGDVWFKEVD